MASGLTPTVTMPGSCLLKGEIPRHPTVQRNGVAVHLSVEEIHFRGADETCHKFVNRCVVKIQRAPNLLNPAHHAV